MFEPEPATAVYDGWLSEAPPATSSAGYHAVGDDGSRRRLPLERWLGEPDAVESRLLEQAVGPVLDVGCGPGRHLVELGRRGVAAVGVDVSAGAAAIARERGASVLQGSVFDLAEPGAFRTALLLDGNLGIGGDPERLLVKVAELLRPGGAALVELEPPRTRSRLRRVRLEGPQTVSDWIPWALVGAEEVAPIAAAAGLPVEELWSGGGRWFARLRRTGLT